MTKKETFWAVIAALHLSIAVAGALGYSFWGWGKPGAAIAYYGLVSGASSGYSFFAPDVGSGLRAQFEVYDQNGKLQATEELERSSNRETTLRLYDLVETLSNEIDEEYSRWLLGRSWAGKVFSRHPSATRLVLHIDTIDVPTMEDYRAGERYDWEPYYSATFKRASPKKGRRG